MKTPPPVNAAPFSQGSGTGQILLLLLYLALILLLVYYATRLFGKFAQRGSLFGGMGKSEFRPGRYISLIDRMAVDKSKAILLVRVKDEFYLLGVADENVSLLEKVKLSAEELEAGDSAEAQPAVFSKLLETWKERGTHEKS